MAGEDLIRPSRDGDQFHYHWAARQCLGLLPSGNDLVAVTIEGPSAHETADTNIAAGEQLIDVGLYYGSELRESARLVRYIQLKHSTRRAQEAWTPSGLKNTIRGFAKRYEELLQNHSADDIASRFRFEFTTNRPIDSKLSEALHDLSSESEIRHPSIHKSISSFTELEESKVKDFFKLFHTEGSEPNLWGQRNLLTHEINFHLPDADSEAPVQLKDLVTRKATSEFESDPSIRKHDVLRALKVDEAQMQPAPCLIRDIGNTQPRTQEQQILQTLLKFEGPFVIHADGGLGKSVLAARLAASMPNGSEAFVYDCFGNGLYRNAFHFRHRCRDAFVQISNELSAKGLCYPLIPTTNADEKQYIRAFVHRISQAIRQLKSKTPDACLVIIIDAADNAEMAAEEQGEPSSFARHLIRAPIPDGVKLVFTCRTHRRTRLDAPQKTTEIELQPFNESESADHLRNTYPSASAADAAEFAFLTSHNPRVQALAISRNMPLSELLRTLGPQPTTVDKAIGELLTGAVTRLREQAGPIEASKIEVICQALAVLRPLVPIPLLAQISQTSESAVRSFATDIGHPLVVKGNTLHFLDEPAETWFREKFQPDAEGLAQFLARLKPVTAQSSYAAGVLPQLLLHAGKLQELVELALSREGLPTENPLERRDVELQRLTFALKACLQRGHHLAAVKLALMAGGECAGEQRQNQLIQDNTDIAATLMGPDRLQEVASRRAFHSAWMGAHHAYGAGLLSGRQEFYPEASSELRMAMEWLQTWARLPNEQRQRESVSNADRAELAIAILRLQGPNEAAAFLRRWKSRRFAFDTGRLLAKRLIDLSQFNQIDLLAEAAGNNIWLILGLARETREVGHRLPAAPLARLLRLLGDRRVRLEESKEWNANWELLYAITCAIEIALTVSRPDRNLCAEIIRRYLPPTPPTALTERFGFERGPLVRSYALESSLRGNKLSLIELAPPNIRKELDAAKNHSRSQESDIFLQDVGGILPWFILSAEIACGRPPSDPIDSFIAAEKETSSAISRRYRDENSIYQTIAAEYLRILVTLGATSNAEKDHLKTWLNKNEKYLWPDTQISMCRSAARTDGLEPIAIYLSSGIYNSLELMRDNAETRTESYLKLARAILAISHTDAAIYFNRAVEIASRIGEENLHRWTALLNIAKSAGTREFPRQQTAYRLSRIAELTYEYVDRDKHFDWEHLIQVLVGLDAQSSISIMSRWRDRRFGSHGRLLPIAIYCLIERGELPAIAPIILAGLDADWNRFEDLERACDTETNPERRSVIARIAYRYMRVQTPSGDALQRLKALANTYSLEFPDLDRLISADTKKIQAEKKKLHSNSEPEPDQRHRNIPEWEEIFKDIDLKSPASLRTGYDSIRSYDPPFQFAEFFREALARTRVGRESEIVSAIAAWPDFGIFQLRELLSSLPSPTPNQVSFRKAAREAILSACRHDPRHVHRTGWGRIIPYEKLYAEGLVTDEDVVGATLEGFTLQIDTLDAHEIFQLVDPLASCLSSEEADEALNFGLNLLEDMLRPEDGDGPWCPELQPPKSLISALGAYIWAGLGSPVVAVRWQYAHAVRAMVEWGWSEILEALIISAQSDSAAPFVDKELEFYAWHARQWLLIGLARGGRENAAALRPFMSLLQGWLSTEHVLIREFTAKTLKNLVDLGDIKADAADNLNRINQSSLPKNICSHLDGNDSNEDSSSIDPIADNDRYYFGIDIGPYWYAPLGNAFALSQRAIELRAMSAIRKKMGVHIKNRTDDNRYKRKIYRDGETHHSHGGMPKAEDLQTYHAYHAMMMVAANLLKERPVQHSSNEPHDQFQEWLNRYLSARSDGGWLSDARDPRLISPPSPPKEYSDKTWRWGVTTTHLDNQLESDDGLIVLWGHWDSGELNHHETVSVRSALVSLVSAEALLASLQTAQNFGRFFLPGAREDNELDADLENLRGWVQDEDRATRFDEGDPWATRLRFPGPSPSDEIITEARLNNSLDGRTWTTNSNPYALLRRETWTYVQGYGREEETIAGVRLCGNKEFVKHLLNSYPEHCLIISVTINRRPPRRSADDDEYESYQWPYIRYYLMEADGDHKSL